MAYFGGHHYAQGTVTQMPSPLSSVTNVHPQYTSSSMMRRKSSTLSTESSTSSTTTSPRSSRPSSVSTLSSSSIVPRVQLIPHTHSFSFESTLSPSERQAVDNTSFDTLDLSSKDFDFEDIFTYGRPAQHKLNRVVEVSSPTRESARSSHGQPKDREGGFSFSHFGHPSPSSGGPKEKDRAKMSRARSGIGGMYVKNGIEARRR